MDCLFHQELLRRAALAARGDDGGDGPAPPRVTDAHLNAAPDQLLDARNDLTRVLLGGQAASEPPPGAADAV